MKVAVFGAGTMGSGIAQVFAAKGHTALMYASSVASAQKHKDKLAASLQKRVEKGKMTQEAVDALLANILVEEKSACADADLIIECVKEDMATKKELLNELDVLCKPEAIFASNTSSLSITEMGQDVYKRQAFSFANEVPGALENAKNTEGFVTVSYTHLDVYKRQNQQKAVFARALMTAPKVLLCDEPTQAVDVSTRTEIHRLLRDKTDGGAGVRCV